MIYTSLNEIKSFGPCPDGWKKILHGQNKTAPDDELFPLTKALESNSISDVLWLLGKKGKEVTVCVEFARLCAESVAHLDSKHANALAAEAAFDAAYAVEAAAYAISTDAAAEAAAYAVRAANYAANAVAYEADAYQEQQEKNKQFLRQCIEAYPL